MRINLKDDFISDMLSYLGIEFELTQNEISFQPPSWRYDLDRPVDLIEELAKHYGFNNFESTLPIGISKNNVGEYWHLKKALTDKLISMNLYEIQTLSFVSDESNKIFTPEKVSVEINNPYHPKVTSGAVGSTPNLMRNFFFDFNNSS